MNTEWLDSHIADLKSKHDAAERAYLDAFDREKRLMAEYDRIVSAYRRAEGALEGFAHRREELSDEIDAAMRFRDTLIGNNCDCPVEFEPEEGEPDYIHPDDR